MERVADAMEDTNVNLQGSLIELWNIDASIYPLIDLKFTFGSGVAISSPILHGFNLGTLIGTNFNNTDGVFRMGGQYNGDKWTSAMQGSSELFLMTAIKLVVHTSGLAVFSMPIVAVKPMICRQLWQSKSLTGLSLVERPYAPTDEQPMDTFHLSIYTEF